MKKAGAKSVNTGDLKKSKAVKKDDPEQSLRFVETAKQLDADESGKSFDQVFRQIHSTSDAPKLKPENAK